MWQTSTECPTVSLNHGRILYKLQIIDSQLFLNTYCNGYKDLRCSGCNDNLSSMHRKCCELPLLLFLFVTDLFIWLSFWHSPAPWECDKINRSWPLPKIHASQKVKKQHPKGTKHQILLPKILWTYVLGSVDVRPKGAWTYGERGWGRTSIGCLDVRARNLWTVQNGTERFA